MQEDVAMMWMMEALGKILKSGAIFFSLPFLLLLLLVFKDPFSERTLIPNFEPFPDTIYYIGNARSFVQGLGFNVIREGRVLKSTIPPLYSIFLIPGFLVNQDPRVYYFSNVLLSLSSALIFWLISQKIFKNNWISFSLTIFYVTNYFIYWVPTLAMAENLQLFLFLAGCFILVSPLNKLKTFLLGLVIIGFYATKYASLPLSVSFFGLFLFKSLSMNLKKADLTKQLLVFLGSCLLAFVVFFWFNFYFQAGNILQPLINIYLGFFKNAQEVGLQSNVGVQKNLSGWFSLAYLPANLKDYLRAITGERIRFLWDWTPLVPKYIGYSGLLGLFIGVFKKSFSFLAATLLILLFSSIIFMSTFYALDARYIYHSIPIILLGLGVLMKLCYELLSKRRLKGLFYFLGGLFLIFYLLTNFIRIKSQISINLRYAETPWYYLSIKSVNDYFDKNPQLLAKKPVLISPMVPYLFDFYLPNRYIMLPLSTEQEFRSEKKAVWGDNDYSDLAKLYKKYIDEGYSVYLARYGLGNETGLNRDFREIDLRFKLNLVKEGCFEQCNLYKLEDKAE